MNQENNFGKSFGKWTQDPKFMEQYEEEFKEFALSELLLALMAEDQVSVRKLAEIAGISPTSIQKLRSGKAKDVGLKNFVNIVHALGYELVLHKGEKQIAIGGD